MKASADHESETRTWALILLMVFLILLQGFFSLFVVQDRGQPSWDYRPVRDVPGESPYAIYQKLSSGFFTTSQMIFHSLV